MLHQTNWAQTLNKFLSNPILQGHLQDEALISGANTINHLLGRPINGCMIVLQDAAANFFEAETTNPNQTFVLNASAPCNVSLYLF